MVQPVKLNASHECNDRAVLATWASVLRKRQVFRTDVPSSQDRWARMLHVLQRPAIPITSSA